MRIPGGAICALGMLCFSLFCSLDSQNIISAKKLVPYNQKILKRIWVLKKNVYSPRGEKKELLFTRNSRVRLLVETGKDWLIVRAYPVRENIERNQGRTILYLYPLKKKEFNISNLDQTIYSLAR